MKKWKKLLIPLLSVLVLATGSLAYGIVTKAAGSIYESPYVSFSPDGGAWTTNAGDQNTEWYPEDTVIYTGLKSNLRSLNTGEHYYKYNRTGMIPIKEWHVSHKYGQCIHNAYPDGNAPYHNIPYGTSKCGSHYYSGWGATCADCGDVAVCFLVYMSEDAARSINYVDTSLEYYYLCPFCSNLEQGTGMGHKCSDISWNKYSIIYNKNMNGVKGFMPDSTHYYNNATSYEGQPVNPQTNLTLCSYTKDGYVFTGWNTEPDGSGDSYTDGQEIYNLTDKYGLSDIDDATITLYAQWKKVVTTLNIDPNGGSYNGSTGITSISQEYGSSYTVDTTKIVAPVGYTVSFDVLGGEEVSPITSSNEFAYFSLSNPFNGFFKNNRYIFRAPNDGNVDTITAQYNNCSVILPDATREGYSFAGWYSDSNCTTSSYVGVAGDSYVPSKDITLYAKWVALILYSKDNYIANDGKGAVDLSWSQPDGLNKTYKIYQSEGTNDNYKLITSSNDIGKNITVDKTFNFSGVVNQTYTVPYSGIYNLEVYGAQGANYGGNTGGKGGNTSLTVWLDENEVLTYTIGGQNGFNGGGGSNASFSNGGGYTIISSDKKGTIAIAGGGGGAGATGSGGDGGLGVSVIAGSNGEAGGGGGGYQGGACGHKHTHLGTLSTLPSGVVVSNVSGLCYTDGSYSTGGTGTCYVEVKKFLNSQVIGEWAGSCGACGNNWGLYYYGYIYVTHSYSGHSSSDYNEFVIVCPNCGNKTSGDPLPSSHSHTYSTLVPRYGLSCNKSEYNSYGGSSYVNSNAVLNSKLNNGVCTGNGYVSIKSISNGYISELFLNNVVATDHAAPNAVDEGTVKIDAKDSTNLTITWSKPNDNGTRYFHKVESYKVGVNSVLSTSNETQNVLTSGVKGYKICVDTNPTTEIDSHHLFVSSPNVDAILNSTYQYLHIAAVDVAENISDTIHIPLGSITESPVNPPAPIYFPIKTSKMGVSTINDNLYQVSDNTYFVRADGSAFKVDFNGYVDGLARDDYQVTDLIFNIGNQSSANKLEISVDRKDVSFGDCTYPNQYIMKYFNGAFQLTDAGSVTVSRYNKSNVLSVTNDFSMGNEFDGQKLYLYPIAGAKVDNDDEVDMVYSNLSEDYNNGVWLIGDGTPPTIGGTEIFEEIDVIHGGGTHNFTFTAKDDENGSGLKEFYVVVTNKDNFGTKTFYSTDGTITLTMSHDDSLFNGNFDLEFHTIDNVGNERVETYGTTQFFLEVSLTHCIDPTTNVFRAGESGILDITTWGYADKVIVEFPDEFLALNPGMNKTYEYLPPEYKSVEALKFMVPLGTPNSADGEYYKIKVSAYKDGSVLERYPELSVLGVNGSVLEDLRTRLR